MNKNKVNTIISKKCEKIEIKISEAINDSEFIFIDLMNSELLVIAKLE